MRNVLQTANFSVLALGVLCAVASCRVRRTEPAQSTSAASSAVASTSPPGPALHPSASAPATPEPANVTFAVVAVAGIGSSPQRVESALLALELARHAREAQASCLDTVVAAIAALEDDPALNAGTGSALRLDGSVELEAAVMSSAGLFGAVSGLDSIRYPSRVARAVVDTPHRVLGGAGAQRFARQLGTEAFELRTDATRQRYRSLLADLAAGGAHDSPAEVTPWPSAAAGGAPAMWQSYLPKPSAPVASAAPIMVPAPSPSGAPSAIATSPPARVPASPSAAPPPSLPTTAPATVGGDTVAVLARCAKGDFAGAASSGGPWLSLPGRMGDVPVPGAALYVGTEAAVFVTGHGETILDKLLARAIYEKLVNASSASAAVTWALGTAAPGQLAVAIVDAHGIEVGPEGATAWAMQGPELSTSKGGP